MKRTINLIAKGLTLPQGPIKAPASVLLWEPGLVVGDFGENVWDAKAAADVMANYVARGNPVPIDVEHNSNPEANPKLDPNNPPKGGGYALLKLDSRGALWCDPIRWSDYARSEIESGSRNAISPDWDYDPATKRPVRLKRVSLVQNPGTYSIGLMASARANGDKKMDLSFVLAALKAANQGDMANPAIDALIAEIEKAMAGGPASEAAPMDAGACPPGEDPKKLMASAMQMLKAAQKPAAPSMNLETVRREARAAYREEAQKFALIASAKDRPGMTDALQTQLQGMALNDVKGIVSALPPAPAAPANATASAAPQGAVKVGPMAGAEPQKPALSAKEEMSIELIEKMSLTGDALIASAKANANMGGKSVIAEDGSATFSAFSQMKGASKAN